MKNGDINPTSISIEQLKEQKEQKQFKILSDINKVGGKNGNEITSFQKAVEVYNSTKKFDNSVYIPGITEALEKNDTEKLHLYSKIIEIISQFLYNNGHNGHIINSENEDKKENKHWFIKPNDKIIILGEKEKNELHDKYCQDCMYYSCNHQQSDNPLDSHTVYALISTCVISPDENEKKQDKLITLTLDKALMEFDIKNQLSCTFIPNRIIEKLETSRQDLKTIKDLREAGIWATTTNNIFNISSSWEDNYHNGQSNLLNINFYDLDINNEEDKPFIYAINNTEFHDLVNKEELFTEYEHSKTAKHTDKKIKDKRDKSNTKNILEENDNNIILKVIQSKVAARLEQEDTYKDLADKIHLDMQEYYDIFNISYNNIAFATDIRKKIIRGIYNKSIDLQSLIEINKLPLLKDLDNAEVEIKKYKLKKDAEEILSIQSNENLSSLEKSLHSETYDEINEIIDSFLEIHNINDVELIKDINILKWNAFTKVNFHQEFIKTKLSLLEKLIHKQIEVIQHAYDVTKEKTLLFKHSKKVKDPKHLEILHYLQNIEDDIERNKFKLFVIDVFRHLINYKYHSYVYKIFLNDLNQYVNYKQEYYAKSYDLFDKEKNQEIADLNDVLSVLKRYVEVSLAQSPLQTNKILFNESQYDNTYDFHLLFIKNYKDKYLKILDNNNIGELFLMLCGLLEKYEISPFNLINILSGISNCIVNSKYYNACPGLNYNVFKDTTYVYKRKGRITNSKSISTLVIDCKNSHTKLNKIKLKQKCIQDCSNERLGCNKEYEHFKRNHKTILLDCTNAIKNNADIKICGKEESCISAQYVLLSLLEQINQYNQQLDKKGNPIKYLGRITVELNGMVGVSEKISNKINSLLKEIDLNYPIYFQGICNPYDKRMLIGKCFGMDYGCDHLDRRSYILVKFQNVHKLELMLGNLLPQLLLKTEKQHRKHSILKDNSAHYLVCNEVANFHKIKKQIYSSDSELPNLASLHNTVELEEIKKIISPYHFPELNENFVLPVKSDKYQLPLEIRLLMNNNIPFFDDYNEYQSSKLQVNDKRKTTYNYIDYLPFTKRELKQSDIKHLSDIFSDTDVTNLISTDLLTEEIEDNESDVDS